MASYSNMPLYLYGNKYNNGYQRRFPLSSAINTNQQEFYDVEVFDDRNYDEGKLKNIDGILNMATYTCHICNIDVPKTYKKEHIMSVKHEACLKITNIALERTHLYMKADIAGPCLKVKVEGTHYCEHCAVIVQDCDSEKHELSRNHIHSVENDKLLQKLVSVYNDSGTDSGVEIDSIHLSVDYLERMNNVFFDVLSADVVQDIASNKEPNVVYNAKYYGNIKENGNIAEETRIQEKSFESKIVLKDSGLTEGRNEYPVANNKVVKKKKNKLNRKKAKENKMAFEENSNVDHSEMVHEKTEQCHEKCTSSECKGAKTYKKTDADVIASKPLKDEFQAKESNHNHAVDNKVVLNKKAKVKKSKQNTKELIGNSSTGHVVVCGQYEQYGKDIQNKNDNHQEKHKQNEKDRQYEKDKQNNKDERNDKEKQNYNQHEQNDKQEQNEKDEQNETDTQNEKNPQSNKDSQNEKEKSREKDQQHAKDKQHKKDVQNDKQKQHKKEKQNDKPEQNERKTQNKKDIQNEKDKSHEKDKQHEKNKQPEKDHKEDEQNDKQKQHEKEKQNDEAKQNETDNQNEKDKSHKKGKQLEKNKQLEKDKQHEKNRQDEEDKQYKKNEQNDIQEKIDKQHEKEEQNEIDEQNEIKPQNKEVRLNEKHKSHEKDNQDEKREQTDKQHEKENQNDKLKQNNKKHKKEQENDKRKQNDEQHERVNQIDKQHDKDEQNDKQIYEKQHEKEKQNEKESQSNWDEPETSTHLNYLRSYLTEISHNCHVLKVKALSECEVELKDIDGEKATVPLINFHGYDIVGDGAIVCRICRGVGLVAAAEHQWDPGHIAQIMTPVDKHFMRKLDGSFSHCILCNTLHLTAETAFHVNHVVHKTNRQNSQQWKQDRIAQVVTTLVEHNLTGDGDVIICDSCEDRIPRTIDCIRGHVLSNDHVIYQYMLPPSGVIS